jgi:hypothetical protein
MQGREGREGGKEGEREMVQRASYTYHVTPHYEGMRRALMQVDTMKTAANTTENLQE